MLRLLTKLFLLISMSFVSGCFNCFAFSPILSQNEVPKEGLAYIYGRFERVDEPNWNTYPGAPTALFISNVGNKRYYAFRIEWKTGVYAIAAEPGEYYISKWGVTGGWPYNELRVQQNIAEHIENNRFRVEPGRAYYLGDYGATQLTKGLSLTTYYALEIPKLNYDKTTREFNGLYPAFSALPKTTIFKDTVFKKSFDKRHVIEHEVILVPVAVPAK